MILSHPVPRTVEELRQEAAVSEDALLSALERQQAQQEEAIRSYKADALVAGAPARHAHDSEEDAEEGATEPDDFDSAADEGEAPEEDGA